MRRYNEALDALHFTEAEQDMLIEQLKQAAAAAQKPKKRRRPPKAILIAAIIACVLTFTAAAGTVVVFFADPDAGRARLADFFNLSPDIVEENTGFTASGASTECNGVTVTLSGMYTDEHNVCALFSVTKQDGSAFVDPAEEPQTYALTFEDIRFLANGEPVNGGGGDNPPSFEPDMREFHLSIEMALPDVQQMEGVPLSFYFSNVCSYKKDGNHIGFDRIVVPGVWTIEVPLTFTETTVQAQAGQQMQYGNLDITIESIAFTPTYYHIEFQYDKEMAYDDDHNLYLDGVLDEYGDTYYLTGASPVLRTRDGSQYQLDYQYSLHGHAAIGLLPEPIPLEEMESITIFGETIPLVWQE